ncbi:MAG: hypothetical protein KF862_14765 [Chitinophagaceae bacterium]|nr:hypothetical protein [Chitinophagaceae bacterium]
MLQVDSLVQSFIDFVKKFWLTFFLTIFRPTKILALIRKDNASKPFVGIYTYLYISIYFSFLVFYAGSFGWFSALDPQSYKIAYETLNGSSLLFLLLVIIPYTLLICLVIFLIIKILRFGKGWFEIVYSYAVYYFSSILLMAVAIFGVLLVFLLSFPKDENGEANVNETIANVLDFVLEYIIVNSYYVLAAIPFFLLVRYYYKINKGRMIRFLILLSSCFSLAKFNDVWFKRLNVVFQEQNNPDSDERKVFINNFDGYYSGLTMQIDTSKSDLMVNANLLVTNNTKTTYLIPVKDSIKIYQAPNDSSSSEFLFKMGIKQWENEVQQVSYILKPGEIKHILVQGPFKGHPIKGNDTTYYNCSLALPTNEFSRESVLSSPRYEWKGYITFKKE